METFNEDILQTFIFCFLASLGIIQIMVGRRGWHGLSLYGGRVRRNVNYAMGTFLVIISYAWYFSNPEHRNVRNIEGFMSMVCLILGIAAAVALTAILASASEGLRRRIAYSGPPPSGGSLRKVSLPHVTALLSFGQESAKTLVILAEKGKGCERLLRRLHATLPREWGFVSLQLPGPGEPEFTRHGDEEGGENILDALDQIGDLEGVRLEGGTFMGLGWGANEMLRLRERLESAYSPPELLAVAPLIPDHAQGIVGDALLSNTPYDICETLLGEKPWRDPVSGRLTRLWLPIMILCVALATLATFIFDIRWKLFSGLLAGFILSLWISYFPASRRGLVGAERGRESKILSLAAPMPPQAGNRPLQVILTPEDSARLVDLCAEALRSDPRTRIELWSNAMRGKFLYDKGTLPRLVNLISGEGDERLQD